MRSIRTKLILLISILVLFILGVTAHLLIEEKRREITGDIYVRARSFAALTARDIIEKYDKYALEGSYIYFNNEIDEAFLKNEDISRIRVVSFDGSVQYDSSRDSDNQFLEKGDDLSSDSVLLQRIQARNPSFLIRESGRVVYQKRNVQSKFLDVDMNEDEVEPIRSMDQIVDIVYPVSDKYVVVYDLSYASLRERIRATSERIVLLAIFGIMVGLVFAYLFSSGITRNLAKLSEVAHAVAIGDFKKRAQVKSRDEVGVLAGAFNSMAKDLEVSTKAKVYKERVAKELELAAKIQRELLPDKIPVISGLDAAAGLIPAAEIGGDCFDFIRSTHEDTVMYIGDVTGHGVPSGLVVAIANAVIYSLVHSNDIREIVVSTNDILKVKTSPNMFLTMCMLNWNSRRKELTYVNAGHEKILQLKRSSKEVLELEGGGMALGMLPDIRAVTKERKVEFSEGDVVVLYSDGIPEARNVEGEEYGLERLKNVILSNIRLKSAEAFKNAILSDVEQFISKAGQLDDITILVLVRE